MKRIRAWIDRLLAEIGRHAAYDPRIEARQAARELHDAMTYVRERDEIRGL